MNVLTKDNASATLLRKLSQIYKHQDLHHIILPKGSNFPCPCLFFEVISTASISL